MENQEQIVDEIRQFCAQYLTEVPSRRRVWPKSIKTRVLQLLELELSCEHVSTATGIPIATLYGWKAAVREKKEAFLPVQVVPERTALAPPKPTRKYRRRLKAAPTLVVIAPGGVRFEGLSVSAALEIAREIRSWV